MKQNIKEILYKNYIEWAEDGETWSKQLFSTKEMPNDPEVILDQTV